MRVSDGKKVGGGGGCHCYDEEGEEEEEGGEERGERKYIIINCGAHISKGETLLQLFCKIWDSTLIFQVCETFPVLCPLRGTYI